MKTNNFANLSDFVIFDNINMSLIDGSTRTSPPIIYKITD